MEKQKNIFYQFDLIDKKILNLIVQNSELSIVKIAKKIGVSYIVVYNRIKKLKKDGVIKSPLTIDPEMLGYNVISFVGIFLNHKVCYFEMLKSVALIDGVVESYCTTGSYPFFVKIICKDYNDLMQIFAKVGKLDGVSKIETFISLHKGIKQPMKL
ncbi:winged helix-turn-helix transcriptional regulator [Chryseobacterium sp.]|uniref:Lrp/AsnC family transcriptional regulator n=1 Tax=Chryseobacterium sp. TaxID=1871047 RepID=UPI002896A985|nr:winged helix-turn-helix transcriptional regulator [Chryseobacterium sp.]